MRMEQTLQFRAMNTEVEVFLQAKDHRDHSAELENIRFLFQRVEKTASRFQPESELSQINRGSAQATAILCLPLSPLLHSLLREALNAYRETEGLFQPAILPALEAAGYDRSFDRLEREELIPAGVREESLPLDFTHSPYAFKNRGRQKFLLLRPGTRLDLGGIAKGWTADRAAEILASLGRGFVNAGGDIRFFGEDGPPWSIGIEDPFAPERDAALLQMAKGAVATSSTWKRRWKRGSCWNHHLIDPRTGRSADTSLVSVTVTAPTAAQADVWAKVALLLGRKEGMAWLKRRRARALLIDIEKRRWQV